MSDQKQLIECIAGGASTSIGSTTYLFERDQYGRFVASVPNIRHRSCLLSVVHYRAVPDHPPTEGIAPGLAGLRSDGPTVEEYVAAGYLASKYPPSGYASRSTAEEIEAAIAAQAAAANPTDPIDGTSGGEVQGEQTGESTDANAANADSEATSADAGAANADSASGSGAGAASTDSQQSNRRRK